jgi:ribosomal protein L21E
MDNLNDYLNGLFYNKNISFNTEKAIYKKAKEEKIFNITHKQIKDYLQNQEVNKIYKEEKRPTKFSSIVADKIRSEYQMDIMVYDRYEHNKYKYILIIVDIYSRYAIGKPMTNRENTTIIKNIDLIFDEMGKPEEIGCDNEFDTLEFRKYCLKNDIKVNYTIPNDIQKNSIVERLNRTIAGYIKKLRFIKIYNWVGELENIFNNYNNSYHRTIRDTPYNIFIEGHKNKQDIFVLLDKFKIGDNVKIKIKKSVFDKGDIKLFSNESYKIVERDGRKILLSNGKYYSSRTLKKVSNIVNYTPPIFNDKEEIEFNKMRKQIDKTKTLKKEGLKEENIIENKRIRKPKNIIDV